MGKRKGLAKGLRFEVLKRDNFTCQYCGDKAPNVLLHVDHMHPVVEGGKDDILNLTTSCEPCNLGKGARRLDDSAILSKQIDQLAELQARRDQLDMLFQWKQGLASLHDEGAQRAATFLQEHFVFGLSDHGMRELKKYIKKCGLPAVLDAIPVAADNYLVMDGGVPTTESFGAAFDKIPGICHLAKLDDEKPHMRDLFYIRGILRNRMDGVVDYQAIQLLEDAYIVAGASISRLKSHAVSGVSWSTWKYEIGEMIGGRL